LCVIGDVLSVRRVDRISVEARIRRDLFWLRAACGRNKKQVAVRDYRFDVIGHCGEAKISSVRLKIDVNSAADLIGRYVVIGSRC
jgi:hypothetical protein